MNTENLFIGHTILNFNELPSTNDYLKENASFFNEGTVVWTKNQTSGRGQQGNKWISEADKNLTFSILLLPHFLQVNKQFYLSMVTALAVTDFLKKFDVEAQIKWPNDILVNKKKISGILIENTLKGNSINCSIVGVGININQTNFCAPNSTSLLNVIKSNSAFNLEELLKAFITIFEKYYLMQYFCAAKILLFID
jgi:BirA family biotin operon repressor/biotin-[acetyl-CoA-carboxylase] ligase